jgi:NADH dehydrogenase FAD-containing subunit
MLTISPDRKTLTQLESFKAHNIQLFSLPLRSITDASLIHDRVSSAVNSGNKQGIVIVGGGATDVSPGGVLSDFIKRAKNQTPVP